VTKSFLMRTVSALESMTMARRRVCLD
jgi:hypothetical protein